MIEMLFILVFVLLLVWLAFYVLQRYNAPEPLRTVGIVVFALVLLFITARYLGLV